MDALKVYKGFRVILFGVDYRGWTTRNGIFIEFPALWGVLWCGVHENRDILPRSQGQVRSLLLGKKFDGPSKPDSSPG